MGAWFESPDNFGTAIGYTRIDPLWPIVRKGQYTVVLGAAGGLPTTTIIAYTCRDGQDVEVDRSVLTAAPWKHTFDISKWPEGHVVLTGVTDANIPFLHSALIVCNSGKPIAGPQWIPVGATNGKHGFSETLETGWEWVRYEDGVTVPRGATLKPREFTPIQESDFKHDSKGKRTWGQPQHDSLWQEPVTACGSIPPHEFVYTTDNGKDSFVTISAVQPYTQNDNFRLNVGQNRDGPYGVGRVGAGICLYGEDDAVVVLSPTRMARVRINGDHKGYVDTLLGRRLKDNTKPMPRAPLGNFAFWDWFYSFYEDVGTITDGNPHLNNPWQMVPDERNPGWWWIADADNNRLVYYNEATRQGFTWAGSLDGSDGYQDAVGTDARFRKVRGVVVDYGDTPEQDIIFIADDHNSAIRRSDRSRVITTEVHAQSALPDRDLGHGVNYGLTILPQTGGYAQYIPLIRSYLKDGPYEAAIWMHPNQLQLDSDKNIRTACHHPHNIIKIDRQNRTITTLANLNPSMQAGKLDLSWISFSVDSKGVFGNVDNMVAGYFLDAVTLVFDSKGTPLGRYWGNDGNTIVADQFLMQGSLRYGIHTGYPWGACYSKNKPYMAYVPTVGEGLFIISRKLPTDQVVDRTKYQRGATLVGSGHPPPYYRRGHYLSKLGEPSAYDFVNKTDDELQAWIRTWSQAKNFSDDDVIATAYYERWNAQHVLAPIMEDDPVEVARLQAENDALRQQLADADTAIVAVTKERDDSKAGYAQIITLGSTLQGALETATDAAHSIVTTASA